MRAPDLAAADADTPRHAPPRMVNVTLIEGRDIPPELAARFVDRMDLTGSLTAANGDPAGAVPVHVSSNGRRPWSVTIEWMEPRERPATPDWQRSFRLGSGEPPTNAWGTESLANGQQLTWKGTPLVQRELLTDTIEPPSTATAGSLDGGAPSRIEDIVIDPSDPQHGELFRFIGTARGLEGSTARVGDPDVETTFVQPGPKRSIAHWIEHSMDNTVRVRERRQVTAWQPSGNVRVFDYRLDLDARGDDGSKLDGFRAGCRFGSTTESGWMRPWSATHVGGKELWRDAAWGGSRIDGHGRSWLIVLMRHPDNADGLLMTTADGFLGVQFERPFADRELRRGTLKFRVLVMPRERTSVTPEAIGHYYDAWVNGVTVDAALVR